MFEHINDTGNTTTGLEVRVDENCLKFTAAYTGKDPDKNRYVVHYMGIGKVRELKEYLEDVILHLEEELAYEKQ